MEPLSPQQALSPRERYEGLLYGSLVADSLSLAPHWIYDQAEIVRRFGRVKDFHAPARDGYHPGKGRGDQTHYGDQTLILLESLEACGEEFVANDFAQRWRHFWTDSTSYRDHATKDTLARLDEGGGLLDSASNSRELGGASRIAPLFPALRDEEHPVIIEAVRVQTALTHATPEVVDTAEFIAHMVFFLMQDVTVANALETVSALPFRTLQPRVYLHQASQVGDLSTEEAILKLGQSCPLEKALPSVFAILLQHGDDLETALIENTMAGGDSAARGLMLGMILGASHGVRAIPERWMTPLRARPQVEKFFKTVGLGKTRAV